MTDRYNHYAKAERLAARAEACVDAGERLRDQPTIALLAQAHAVLALADATRQAAAPRPLVDD